MFCDSHGWDSKQDISDAEQLPVPSWKRTDDQQSSIKQFTGADVVWWHISLIFTLISLIFTYVLTHTNLMWLRPMRVGSVWACTQHSPYLIPTCVPSSYPNSSHPILLSPHTSPRASSFPGPGDWWSTSVRAYHKPKLTVIYVIEGRVSILNQRCIVIKPQSVLYQS